MIDLHTYVGGWIAGLVTGASLMRWRIRSSTPRGGNIGATPLVRNEGRTTAQRIYRGAMWRERGSDIWYPLGNEPDAAAFARKQLNRTAPPPGPEHLPTVTVQGLNWPATLGDFTLVGPTDNQGAWRWYERQHNGTTERVKVDHQLQPLGRTNPRAMTKWRILALALGEKAHPDPRIADRVAMVRLVILGSYLGTNACIVAGVIRHWNR